MKAVLKQQNKVPLKSISHEFEERKIPMGSCCAEDLSLSVSTLGRK